MHVDRDCQNPPPPCAARQWAIVQFDIVQREPPCKTVDRVGPRSSSASGGEEGGEEGEEGALHKQPTTKKIVVRHDLPSCNGLSFLSNAAHRLPSRHRRSLSEGCGAAPPHHPRPIATATGAGHRASRRSLCKLSGAFVLFDASSCIRTSESEAAATKPGMSGGRGGGGGTGGIGGGVCGGEGGPGGAGGPGGDDGGVQPWANTPYALHASMHIAVNGSAKPKPGGGTKVSIGSSASSLPADSSATN
eukprot:scaffold5290_cov63-Phaeocystis_antarctica.AAC.6